MPGFREKQPPFHKEAECGTRHAEPGQGRPSHSAHHQRVRRRAKGLPNWRACRYADDFVVLVDGTQADAVALREEIASVLAPLGLRLSPAKTRVVRAPRAQEGEVGM